MSSSSSSHGRSKSEGGENDVPEIDPEAPPEPVSSDPAQDNDGFAGAAPGDMIWHPDSQLVWRLSKLLGIKRVAASGKKKGKSMLSSLALPSFRKSKSRTSSASSTDSKASEPEIYEIAVVEDSNGMRDEYPVGDTHPFDPTHSMPFDDISLLNDLHEGPLLDLLRRRYAKEIIYTDCSDVLISINPYKTIPGLYNIHGDAWREIPHVYRVADRALAKIKASGKTVQHQSIIVSGESGAGKTEAAKCIMRFLVAQSEDSESGNSKIEQQVLESNPLLEAFGNAKTIRNDNSSRFGKFIKIMFSENDNISGGWIEHFLLERSRIVQQEADERNYHIFYQLLAGADEQLKGALKLLSTGDYEFLKSSGCTRVDDVDDVECFQETLDSMRVVGLSDEERMVTFKIVSAVLRLGNISLKSDANDACSITAEGMAHLAVVAELLGVDADQLKSVLTVRTIAAGRGSLTRTPMTAAQALRSRNAFAKSLYEKLFGWLVKRINDSIGSKREKALRGAKSEAEIAELKAMGGGAGASKGYIGLLDIYGFEIMNKNSFEQLCINFANEMLQQHFNHHIFVLEQQVYAQDGIEWSKLSFTDNTACLELIQAKPQGIMVLLDEQAVLGQRNATDIAFLNKLKQAHGNGKHTHFAVPKIAAPVFIVKHFAGDVSYSVDGFLAKNDDTINSTLSLMLANASNNLVKEFFFEEASKQEKSAVSRMGAKTTVGSRFREQLRALNGTLSETAPHYVRCIKPNNLKYPGGFNSSKILEQLRYCGVLETVRIRCEGFPVRLEFAAFCEKYKILTNARLGRYFPFGAAPALSADASDKDGAASMLACFLNPLGLSEELADWQLGNTKVFLKDKARKGLDATLRSLDHNCAAAIQGQFRRILQVRRYKQIRKVFIKLQARIRCKQRVERLEKARKGFEAMQAMLRRRYHAKIFARKRSGAVKLQAFARATLARAKVGKKARQNRAAVAFQSRVRGHLAFCEYQKARAAAIAIENYQRAKMARKRLSELRKAKNEKERAASTLIQAWGRSRMSRAAFLKRQQAILVFQTLARARKAMNEAKQRLKEKNAATKLEAWSRMLRDQRTYRAAYAAIVKIEASARMGFGRKRLRIAKAAATKLASIARRRAAEKRLCKSKMAAVRVAAWERRRAGRAAFKKMRAAAVLIQRAARKSAAEAKLKLAMEKLHECVRMLDMDGMGRILMSWPELKDVRLPKENGRQSLLHVAAARGGFALVKNLIEKQKIPFNVVDIFQTTPIAVASACMVQGGHRILDSPMPIERKNSAVLASLPPPPPLATSASGKRAPSKRTSLRIHQKIVMPQHFEVVRYLSDCEVTIKSAEESAANAKEKAYVPKTGFAGVGLVKLGKILNREKAIVQGYLKKRKLNTRFKKRWFVLNMGVLSYYSREKDTEPRGIIDLEGAMLKRSKESKYTFEIHTPALLDAKRNKEGRMYLQAKSDSEVQTWINAIAALPRVNWAGRSGWQRGLPKNVRVVSWTALAESVNVANGKGMRPLHFLAKGVPSDASIRLCAWLLESGADDKAVDNTGMTALHYAAETGNKGIVKLLVQRGKPEVLDTRNIDGKTPVQIASSNSIARLLVVSSLGSSPLVGKGKKKAKSDSHAVSTFVQGHSIKSVSSGVVQKLPSRIFKAKQKENFSDRTYPWLPVLTTKNTDERALCLSVFFESIGTSDVESLRGESAFLRLHAVNESGDLLEAPQVSNPSCDLKSEASSVYFGVTYHMRTPIEQLGNGTSLVVELCHRSDSTDAKVLSWARIPLQSKDLMTSASFTYGLFTPPVVFSAKRGRKASLPKEGFISGEVILHRPVLTRSHMPWGSETSMYSGGGSVASGRSRGVSAVYGGVSAEAIAKAKKSSSGLAKPKNKRRPKH